MKGSRYFELTLHRSTDNVRMSKVVCNGNTEGTAVFTVFPLLPIDSRNLWTVVVVGCTQVYLDVISYNMATKLVQIQEQLKRSVFLRPKVRLLYLLPTWLKMYLRPRIWGNETLMLTANIYLIFVSPMVSSFLRRPGCVHI